MIKRIALMSIALAVFAAAPALAQSQKEQKAGAKKACCAKTEQVKQDDKGCCSKDPKHCTKECKTACPACGKELVLKLAADGKSCTGTCPACGKVVTQKCDGKHHGQDGCCSAKPDAKSGCAAPCEAGKKAGCASASTCTASKAAEPAGCAKGDGKDSCGDTNCAGEMVRYKGMPVPRMVYQVGDQRMTCAKSCAALAAQQNSKIQYVVAGKVYDEKSEALAAYADTLDGFLNDLMTVKYCVDGKTTCCNKEADKLAKQCGKPATCQLAAFKFDCPKSSEEAVKQAKAAVGEIEMVIMVGDQKFACPVEASKTAKAEGKEVDYCVGKMRTTSETVAHIQLTTAKIKAAVDAYEKCGGKPI